MGGVSRNERVATIGLDAIVSIFLSEIYHAVCTRVNSKIEAPSGRFLFHVPYLLRRN